MTGMKGIRDQSKKTWHKSQKNKYRIPKAGKDRIKWENSWGLKDVLLSCLVVQDLWFSCFVCIQDTESKEDGDWNSQKAFFVSFISFIRNQRPVQRNKRNGYFFIGFPKKQNPNLSLSLSLETNESWSSRTQMMQRDPDDRLNYSNRKVAVDISTDSVSTIQEATTTRRKDTKSKERSRILKRIQSRTKVLVMENRGKRTLKSLSLSPSSKERQQEITRKADQDKKRVKWLLERQTLVLLWLVR